MHMMKLLRFGKEGDYMTLLEQYQEHEKCVRHVIEFLFIKNLFVLSKEEHEKIIAKRDMLFELLEEIQNVIVLEERK